MTDKEVAEHTKVKREGKLGLRYHKEIEEKIKNNYFWLILLLQPGLFIRCCSYDKYKVIKYI